MNYSIIHDNLATLTPQWTGVLITIGGAILLSLLSLPISRRLAHLGRMAPEHRRPSLERVKTVEMLMASVIRFMALLASIIALLTLVIATDTLVWVLGLFSAAFGLAARPLVSDLLAGIGFIFSDTFDIGEKVEFHIGGDNIQGVVEEVNLRNTRVRAPTGELFTLPNGEIGVVRNFSRGKFSAVQITLFVAPEDLQRAMDVLQPMATDIYHQFDDLVEPWQVISTSTLTSRKVELTVIAHASLGKGAELKIKLINLVHESLKQAGVELQE